MRVDRIPRSYCGRAFNFGGGDHTKTDPRAPEVTRTQIRRKMKTGFLATGRQGGSENSSFTMYLVKKKLTIFSAQKDFRRLRRRTSIGLLCLLENIRTWCPFAALMVCVYARMRTACVCACVHAHVCAGVSCRIKTPQAPLSSQRIRHCQLRCTIAHLVLGAPPPL